MSVIVLTPSPDDASVGVAITGAPATVTIWRTGANGDRVALRGAPFPTQGGALALVDREAPLGFVSYSTTADDADAVSTVLDVSVPWLTSPAAAAFRSTPIRVVSDVEWTYDPRTYLFDVIDRADPVFTFYKRSTRKGRITLAYESTAERDAILSALAPGVPVLVRYPPACSHMGGGYYGAGDVRVYPLAPGSTQGTIEIDYGIVAMPPGESAARAGWAWSDVVAAYPTWSAVVGAFGSWSDLVTHDPTPAPRRPAPMFGG